MWKIHVWAEWSLTSGVGKVFSTGPDWEYFRLCMVSVVSILLLYTICKKLRVWLVLTKLHLEKQAEGPMWPQAIVCRPLTVVNSQVYSWALLVTSTLRRNKGLTKVTSFLLLLWCDMYSRASGHQCSMGSDSSLSRHSKALRENHKASFYAHLTLLSCRKYSTTAGQLERASETQSWQHLFLFTFSKDVSDCLSSSKFLKMTWGSLWSGVYLPL